jgi:hypothetical protein
VLKNLDIGPEQPPGFENRVNPDGGLIRCKAGGWGVVLVLVVVQIRFKGPK